MSDAAVLDLLDYALANPSAMLIGDSEARLTRVESPISTATRENPYINSLGMRFVPVPIIGTNFKVIFEDQKKRYDECWRQLTEVPTDTEAREIGGCATFSVNSV